MLFRTIFRLFIFVGLVPVGQWFKFIPSCCNPMRETSKPGSSIPVETCFFLQKKILANLGYYLSAYFCLLSSAEKNFLKTWILYSIPKALFRVFNGGGSFVPDILDFCCNFY